MKRILLPTDFSDNAWNAIVYAIEIHKNIACEFYILNVYDINVMSESGSVVDVLKDVVKSLKVDLIVMGTQGISSVANLFLGSTTQKTIRIIDDCPIMVVPENFYFEGISEIGFATDFQRIYYNSEINPILDIAKGQDATIRMIHIYDKPTLDTVQNYNSNTLEKYFKKIKYEFHVIQNFSNVEKGIQVFIEELEIDVLAMINYKHSFIERLTREKVIRKMIFHTRIPILIIPADT